MSGVSASGDCEYSLFSSSASVHGIVLLAMILVVGASGGRTEIQKPRLVDGSETKIGSPYHEKTGIVYVFGFC